MDLPFDQADSPSSLRGIAGPLRTPRLQTRQDRNSALKPYGRRSLVGDGVQQGRTESLLSSSASSIKSAKSKVDRDSVKAGGVGLLSGLRQAIFSRPLSWLQGASSSKASSSATALPSCAAPMLSAAQKLAASVKASNRPNDIETHANGVAGRIRAPAPAPPASNYSTANYSQPSAFNHTPARSPSPARSSASAAIQSHGRQRLSVGPPPQSPKFGGSTLGTPGYRRGGSLRPDSGSLSGIGASQSSPAFAFGFGSERRMAGVSSAVSAHSHMPLSPLIPSTSYNPLPSRSPFAMKRQSLAESSAGGSVLGYDRSPRIGGLYSLTTPSRSRPTSIFGGEYSRSRAGSVADSRMSTSSQTPKRREWSSLKMAPPKADMSAGEELMQAYLAMRNGAESSDASAHPALQNGTDTLMMDFGAGPSSMHRHSELYGDASLKRGVSMSIDGDEAMSEVGSRKRQKQMVWDPELGFVSKEDLRASRPSKPIPQNEAERLLNALEGLRAPTAGSSARPTSRGATPSRQMMPVSVPLPVPERSDVHPAARQRKVEDLLKTVSPYSRAMRSKLSQSAEPEDRRGLKSKLQRPVEASKATEKKNHSIDKEETFDESMGRGDSDEEDKSMASEAEAEEEEITEPPRRKLNLRSNNDKDEVKKTLRSGKVLPPSPAKKGGASVLSPSKLGSSSAPSSRPMSKARLEISASGTSAAIRQKAGQQPAQEHNAAPVVQSQKKDSLFQVRSDATMERSRSSLRQGAEKTHRSHGKSGRVGLDDDEDDEVDDLPSAEELNKIKLPTNLFPQGFTFSGSPSPLLGSNGSSSSAFSKEATPSTEPFTIKPLPAPSGEAEKQTSGEAISKQSQKPGPPGGSLLGRLGGFAPAPQPSSEPIKPSMPSFSFTAPAAASSEKPTPASKPLFSFQPSSKTSTSDFFSAPAPVSSEKDSIAPKAAVTPKDGPIPNFFASSLAKSDSKEESKAAATPLSFSFGKPAELKAPEGNATPVPATAFSFGAPSTSSSNSLFSVPLQPAKSGQTTDPSSAAPSFSFTPKTSDKETSAVSFQGFGKSTDAAKDGNQAAPVFGGFGAKPAEATPSTVEPAAPGFSFGAAPAPADASKKRGAEEQDGGGPLKKSNGFTSPINVGFNSSPAKTDGFSFGTPKTDKEGASSTGGFGTPLQFKPPMESTEAKAAQISNSVGFSFGGANAGKSEMMDTSPSSAQTGFNPAPANIFGSASPTPASSKPAFSFAAPATAVSSAPSTAAPAICQSGFAFGVSSPAKLSNTPTAAPSFSFGAPASNTGSGNLFGQSSAPASNPFGASAAPPSAPSTGGFGSGGFGSTSNAADGSRQGSPAPFTFGAPASQPMTSGFSGGFGQNTGTAQSMGVSSPSAPSFGFGAQSAVSAPTTPGANNPSGFSFSMPAANGGASNSFGMPAEGAAPSSQATPFVFGATSGTSTPPQQQAGAASGFSFNMGASAPQSPSNSLFNMGSAPPPGSSGSRPMRGMPARRKR